VKDRLFQKAGTALIWRAVQLAGVKVIFMLRLLILARLLSPEDFGLLAIAVTAVGFLLGVTDIGMIPALVQGRDVDEQQYNAAWTVGVTRALLVVGCVVVAAPLIAKIFAEPRATDIIRVLAIRPLLDAAASIEIADLTRNLQFRSLAVLKLVEALTNTTVSIALASTFGVWALVAGTLAGSASYLVTSYLVAPHRPRLSFNRHATGPLIRFGRWIFLTSLIVMAGSYVLRVVISRQLGAAELGLYFLAAQLAFLPAELSSEVIGSVAFPLFARLQSNILQVTQAFRTILTGISALFFPVCTLTIALAPTLVQDLLGPKWAGTVPVIRILTLVSMIGLFGEVAVPILKGLGQPYKVTVIEMVQSLLLIAGVWFLTSRYGLVGAALAWLPAMVVSQIVGMRFVQQLLERPFAGLGGPLLAITVASVAGAVVALLVDNLVSGLPGLVIATLVAVLTIGVLLWASDRRFALGLRNEFVRILPQIAVFMGYSP